VTVSFFLAIVMGIFSFFSGSNSKPDTPVNENKTLNWLVLDKLEDLEALSSDSHNKPVLIYKHSTRCGVSSMAKKRIEKEWPFENDEVSIYYLDLIAFRNVSNEIERRFNVQHQSPQLIALYKGKVVNHNSHYAINLEELTKIFESLK
jgi:bacillithiol system protein YtxJ